MAIYGVSVFMETPEHLRRERKRYIATSLAITILTTFLAPFHVARYFPTLFHSEAISSLNLWSWFLGSTIRGVLVAIGDGLLVRM